MFILNTNHKNPLIKLNESSLLKMFQDHHMVKFLIDCFIRLSVAFSPLTFPRQEKL